MSSLGLHRLPVEELKRLLRALHKGALPSPVTRSALIEKAFGNIEGNLDSVVGRDVESAKAMIAAVLAERGPSQSSPAELVYMGVASPGTRSRDLLEQVRELLTSATQSLELYGLVPGEPSRVLLRSVSSVCEGRGVAARLVFDQVQTAEARSSLRELVREAFRGLASGTGREANLAGLEVWTCPEHRLGMRLVIADGARLLMTSGELHANEDDRRIELGIRLNDTAYIAAWQDEWTRLVASSAVQRLDLA
jgi:hypothetical protein